MADKFARTKFYNQNIIDGIIENDVAYNNFSNFKFKRPRIYYTVKREDINRPDLISLKAYSTIRYWWIILKLNDIDDPFNDLEAGKSLQLPHSSDIEEFYIEIKKNK